MFKAVRPRKTIRFSSRSCETAPSRATCSALPLSRAETRFSAAVRRMERALYYDYELGDDFYPQFCQNIEILMPLLDRML